MSQAPESADQASQATTWWTPTRAFNLAGLIAILLFVGTLIWDLGGLSWSGEEIALDITPEQMLAGFREGEAWHGLYLRGAKVGFSHLRMRQEADEAWLSNRTVLDLEVMRSRQQLDLKLDARLDSELQLRSFDVDVTSQLADLEASGVVHHDRIDLEIRTAGISQRSSIPIEHPPSFSYGVHPALMKQRPEPGQVFSFELFDPMSLSTRLMEIEYIGLERVTVLGETLPAHHLKQEIAGQTLHVWVSELGEVLQEELPLGVTAIRESEAAATYGLGRGASLDADDLIEAAAITPTDLASDFFEQDRAELILEGASFDGFDLDGGRQRLEPLGAEAARLTVIMDRSGAVLTMDKLGSAVSRLGVEPRAATHHDLPEEVASCLGPELLVQSDAAEIQELARELVADHSTVRAAAEAIGDWVFSSVDKQPVMGLPNALEVLQNRSGDCNEHTALTVALMRASGIPARTVAGVAYAGGKLYYHAWPEYWDGRWVATDPTWGQRQADVGHIRLVAGGLRRQIEIMRLLGKLRVRGGSSVMAAEETGRETVT